MRNDARPIGADNPHSGDGSMRSASEHGAGRSPAESRVLTPRERHADVVNRGSDDARRERRAEEPAPPASGATLKTNM